MALGDKAQYLADRLKSMPDALEKKFDEQLSRLDAAEARGHGMVDRVRTFVDSAEAGIASAENIVNQLTNSTG